MTESIVVRITVSSGDDAEADEAAYQLIGDLHEVDDVALAAPEPRAAPTGARAAELVAVGTMLVTALAQPETVTALLTYLGDWIRRRGRGRLEITVDGNTLIVDHASAEERRQLIDGYVRKVLTPDS